ncbi:hypothetical protein [Mycobacterium sp. M23085]|uniref:hypothetical protein n=1 Tax=Mycobacterium sp. M23085 TaxID=3378087 RepID=UPI0038780219
MDIDKPWALVRWVGPSLTGHIAHFATEAEALAAAPQDSPFTVLDVSKAGTKRPVSIDGILAAGRRVLDRPYPREHKPWWDH